ncbi:MAG TPA: M15 family metallopeptidase [Pyrinomonadaceae bacterium]|jgi:hypothetical protein
MEVPTYKDKTFIVSNNDTRLRRADDLSKAEVYKDGDDIPDGNTIGDIKRIPKRTEVKITGVKTDSERTVYVFAEPIINNETVIPQGWTKASNLEGQFMNEIIGFVPSKWELVPTGNNFTVTDDQALIREGAPNFKSTGKTIPVGTYVLVTEKSEDNAGKYVKVCEAQIANGEVSAGQEIGWTAAVNLTDGCSKHFTTMHWTNQQGANACWRGGKYIGAKVLVNIVGVGGEMEQITLESVEPYFRLRDAAAKKNLNLGIESGFRTYQHQDRLYQLFLNKKGNKAAKPGSSNHQHGQAFDLNTRDYDGDPIYDWLKKNAPKLGFIRTVNGEHWHWEYRPAEAAELAEKGEFKNFDGK